MSSQHQSALAPNRQFDGGARRLEQSNPGDIYSIPAGVRTYRLWTD